MSLEEREHGLVRLVAEQRDEACRRLISEAEESARALLRQTHRKERAHLHRRILQERARVRAQNVLPSWCATRRRSGLPSMR